MKENNRGSMIILTVIGIATLLIAVIGATFAYFTVSIRYVTPPSVVDVQSSTMVIEYDSTNNIEYKEILPGRPDESLKTNKLRFSVTSANNMMTTTKYDVYLKITKNEFANIEGKENLVFYLYQTEIGKRKDSNIANEDKLVNSTAGKLFANKKEEYLLRSEMTDIGASETEKVTIGIIPNNTDPTSCAKESLTEDNTACLLKISDGAVLGNLGSRDEWYFEVWLKETGEEQNYDQGKKFLATIEIVPQELGKETNEPELIK